MACCRSRLLVDSWRAAASSSAVTGSRQSEVVVVGGGKGGSKVMASGLVSACKHRSSSGHINNSSGRISNGSRTERSCARTCVLSLCL